MILLALADALSDSSPVLVTAGAAITIVAVAFGMGMSWARTDARMSRTDGPDGTVERLKSAVKDVKDGAAPKEPTAVELARLRRELSALDRYTSDSDAALSARIHETRTVMQDLLNRVWQAEAHLGYDGRGQTTPLRPEPRPRRPGGLPRVSSDPSDSQG